MRVIALVLGFCALFPSLAVAGPLQWQAADGGNGHYYEWVPGYLTWTSARDAAAARTYLGMPGYLTTITSSAEGDWFGANFGQTGGSTFIGWLGGYQDRTAPDYSEPAGGWRWVTGETWSYTNWWTAKGLPDNFQGNQDWLRTQPVNATIFWDDLQNDPGAGSISGYFVEYGTVPEPGALLLTPVGVALLARRRRNKVLGC